MPHNTMDAPSLQETSDVLLGNQKMSLDGEIDAAGKEPGNPRHTVQLLDKLECLLDPAGASNTPYRLLEMTAAEATEYAVTTLGLDAGDV